MSRMQQRKWHSTCTRKRKLIVQARRHDGTAAVVSSVNGADYGSDDEVYALASAVDAADPRFEEERSADKKAIDPLPPVDHSHIEYDDFGKDFYEESKDIAALTPAEVSRVVYSSIHMHLPSLQSPLQNKTACLLSILLRTYSF